MLLFLAVLPENGMAQDTVKRDHRLKLSAGSGYWQEDLRWSIAGNLQGRNPNILSELVWEDLRGPQIHASLRWNAWKRFYLQGSFSRSFIVAGQATDTDYEGDNRTDPSFHASLDSDQGGSTFASAGIAYDLWRNGRCYFIPQVGNRMSWQAVYLLDREQSGREEELQGTYKTRWNGPYISLEPGVFLTERLTANAVLTYYLIRYQARASWHLIEDFQQPVSFRQWANGQGLDARAGLSLQLRPSFLSVYVSGNYFYWKTDSGTDELYLTSGETPRTRLNEVIRKGFGVSIGAHISF